MYDEFDFEAFRQLGYLLARGAEESDWYSAVARKKDESGDS
jgi:hypothetical protein